MALRVIGPTVGPSAPGGRSRAAAGGRGATRHTGVRVRPGRRALIVSTGKPGGRWTELARCKAPVSRRVLWRVLVDKTEHPERYNPRLKGAEVIDQDASMVLRRTYPGSGAPFVEWIRHASGTKRVEYRRNGETWRTAQAVVDTPEGPHLVYEVDDEQGDAGSAGIDAGHAARVLRELLKAARETQTEHRGGGNGAT